MPVAREREDPPGPSNRDRYVRPFDLLPPPTNNRGGANDMGDDDPEDDGDESPEDIAEDQPEDTTPEPPPAHQFGSFNRAEVNPMTPGSSQSQLSADDQPEDLSQHSTSRRQLGGFGRFEISVHFPETPQQQQNHQQYPNPIGFGRVNRVLPNRSGSTSTGSPIQFRLRDPLLGGSPRLVSSLRITRAPGPSGTPRNGSISSSTGTSFHGLRGGALGPSIMEPIPIRPMIAYIYAVNPQAPVFGEVSFQVETNGPQDIVPDDFFIIGVKDPTDRPVELQQRRSRNSLYCRVVVSFRVYFNGLHMITVKVRPMTGEDPDGGQHIQGSPFGLLVRPNASPGLTTVNQSSSSDEMSSLSEPENNHDGNDQPSSSSPNPSGIGSPQGPQSNHGQQQYGASGGASGISRISESSGIGSISSPVKSKGIIQISGPTGLGSSKPWGITSSLGNDREVFVADRDCHAIFKYDIKGTLCGVIRQWVGNKVTGRMETFNRPTGLAFDSVKNRLIVTDKDNHRVVIMTPDGEIIRTFGKRGHLPGQFSFPWGIAVSKNGRFIVVADSKNHRIQLFTGDGLYLRNYSIFESNPYEYKQQFNSPRGVTFDQKGDQIYVTDFNTNCLYKFDLSLSKKRTIVGPGRLNRPQGLAMDGTGNILVCDSKTHAIRVVSPSGAFINTVDSTDKSRFLVPQDICVLPNGFIALVDNYKCIHLF